VRSPDEFADESQLSSRRQLFSSLARAVTDTTSSAPLPLRLCRMFVELLDAEGGAITLAYTDPERTTLCVTGPMADRLEDLQEVLGQGPGADAYTSGVQVTGTFPADAGRWPMLERSIMSIAASVTVHSLPMRVADEVLGVVTVHRHDPVELPMSTADAQFLADALGAAIARRTAAEDGDAVRWDARDRINQAAGMVIAQLRIDPTDAMALMRAFAFSHSMALDDVATEIIDRRQDFSQNADFSGDEAP
jgi:hypothetical protein